MIKSTDWNLLLLFVSVSFFSSYMYERDKILSTWFDTNEGQNYALGESKKLAIYEC